MWITPKCCLTQLIAVETIQSDEKYEGKLLVVDWTIRRKSYILHMIATMTGGIILVIIPLLALTANQMAKIEDVLQTHGSSEAHHFDDTLPENLHTINQGVHAIDYN